MILPPRGVLLLDLLLLISGFLVATYIMFPKLRNPDWMSPDKVYGLDLSWNMLKQAHSRTPKQLAGKTCYVRRDALNLPFAPDSLDALTCSGALYFFPSLSEVLEQFAGVLRSGGRLTGMTVVTEGILVGR